MYMVPRMAKGSSPGSSARARPHGSAPSRQPTTEALLLFLPHASSTNSPPLPLRPPAAPPFSPLQVFVLCLQLVQRAATTADAQHMSRAIRKTTHIRRNLPTRYLVEAISALMPAGLAASFAQVIQCSRTQCFPAWLCLEASSRAVVGLALPSALLFHRPPSSRGRRSSSLLGLPLADGRCLQRSRARTGVGYARRVQTEGGGGVDAGWPRGSTGTVGMTVDSIEAVASCLLRRIWLLDSTALASLDHGYPL